MRDEAELSDEWRMGDNLWFKEDILPLAVSTDDLAKGLKALDPRQLAEATGQAAVTDMTKGQRADFAETFASGLRGTVLAQRPRARRIAVEEAGSMAAGAAFARGDLYLVRLGMEFELPEEYREARCRFAKAWCRAYISASGPDLPRVLDIAPDHLYEGGPRFVKVEVKPALKLNEVEASLGGVGTDIQIGRVSPATVGYLGGDERAPHWKMTEKEREIDGRYHFWLVLDVPRSCDPVRVRLALLGEADVRTPLNVTGLIPRDRARAEHQVTTLAKMKE